MLTKGLDNVPGTSGNDTIIGSVDSAAGGNVELNTLNSLDIINGGAGVDTLKVSHASGDVTLGNLSNVEIVQIDSASATDNEGDVDTTTATGVTNLNVVRALADIKATAANTTDVSVSGAKAGIEVQGGKNVTVTDDTAAENIVIGSATTGPAGTIAVTDTKQGTGTIDIDGGTDVTVASTATIKDASAPLVAGTIKVGLAAAASGNVAVTQTLTSDATDALTGSAISVEGGTTVTVTTNATLTAKDKNATNNDVTFGAVDVTSDGNTTDVTVTQAYSETEFAKVDDVIVKEKDTVTFKAMTAGQTVTASDGTVTLTFTAAKALTAEQVAAAFSNLIKGDTQSAGGPTANGYYGGTFSSTANALWTSAAASGATVVFTAADEAETNITWGGTATAPTVANTAGSKTTGSAATTNKAVYADVTIDDVATASITTITLDGFKDAKLGNTGAGNELDALTTLNLANSAGDTLVDTASTTLALKLNNIDGGDVDLDNAGANVQTLTITTTGAASDIDLVAEGVKSLTIDAGVALTLQDGTNYDGALETVTIKGAGAVSLGTVESTALKSFSAADNTGGVTVSVSAKTADVHSTFTKYVLSQGNDNVTLVDATVNKAIELGAGDDTITLAATTTALAANIDGGTGSNTLVMDSADANSATGASSSTAFEAKISGFDKLSLGQVATTAQDSVNLDNLDDIKYVISAGAADTKADADVTITVTTQLAAGNTDTASITLNGVTVTTAALTAGGSTAADAGVIATALKAKIDGTAELTALYGTAVTAGVLTITSKVDGMPLIIGAISVSGTGVATSANSVESSELTLDNMLDGGTLELTGDGASTVVNMKDASGDADAFNIVTKVASADVTHGTVTVADVETINITATDTVADDNGDGDTTDAGDAPETATLYLTADAATTVNVTGNANLSLTLAGSDVVELVDASTASGALTFTASLADLVVKGGTGADDLTANANGVKLYGNDGADTFTVNMGFDSVRLFGGAGNDTFNIEGGSTTNSTYTVIDGVNAGDVIKLSSGNAGTTAATSFKATKVELSEGATVTTQALIEKALGDLSANQIGWFTNGDYTFLVVDGAASASTTYQANDDVVVMLVGVHDLSTASYNSTSNTLELA